jgi:hypothetical protein
MAQRTIVTLHDDIDGSEAAETVTFGLDGASYEIDLSAAHAADLRAALAAYVRSARKATASGKAYRRTLVAPDSAAVRAWARSNKLDLPARGRLPRWVVERFVAAQGGEPS